MLFAGVFSKLRGWLYHIATRPGLVLLYMLHFDIFTFLLLDFAILAFLFLSCSIFTNLQDLTSASALASNLSRSGVPFLPINSSKTSSSVYVFMSRRIRPLFNCCRSRVCPSLCRCFWPGTLLYHHVWVPRCWLRSLHCDRRRATLCDAEHSSSRWLSGVLERLPFS